jgi:2-polyprenyl-6-hydroxyphenyl methylase/3-demethylubiquinone-9 3-methyltransferase
MNDVLRARIAALPALNETQARLHTADCKICGQAAPLFDVLDLQKHCAFDDFYKYGLSGIEVPYLRCEACGFLFTCFFDEWRDEDWRRFIYNNDYIRVDPDYSGARAIRLAGIMAKTLDGCQHLRILDYGSGANVFADRMRAAGFTQFESYDPYSSPARPAGPFDIITFMEVLEHTPNPRAAIADMRSMLAERGTLIFSQTVQPANIADIRGAWWYLAPRNGHISTFTIETLTRLLPGPGHRLHGNDWLWAMVPGDTDPAVANAVRRIGPAMLRYRLAAPATGQDDQFYSAEHANGGWFRWSRTAQLRWTIPAPSEYPARIDLQMPFTLEISQGFAAACRVSIGGVAADTSLCRSGIFARARLDRAPDRAPDYAPDYAQDETPGEITVTLQTPPPRSPFEVRGAPDSRALGLALPAC